MKKLSILPLLLLLFVACTKNTYEPQSASRHDHIPPVITTKDDSMGTVQFYYVDPFLRSTCGTITVKMSSGQETNIYGPTGYGSNVGGILRLTAGEYSYTIAGSSGCDFGSGSVVVKANTIQSIRF